jgi:hypothetical protein
MDRSKPTIQWQSNSGQPVTAGEITVTPQSQALIFRWSNGGFVWNRPVAVVVERPGQIQRIPVLDITRIVQWSLLATSVACWIGFAILSSKKMKASS